MLSRPDFRCFDWFVRTMREEKYSRSSAAAIGAGGGNAARSTCTFLTCSFCVCKVLPSSFYLGGCRPSKLLQLKGRFEETSCDSTCRIRVLEVHHISSDWRIIHRLLV
jgi:hypothetical protein